CKGKTPADIDCFFGADGARRSEQQHSQHRYSQKQQYESLSHHFRPSPFSYLLARETALRLWIGADWIGRIVSDAAGIRCPLLFQESPVVLTSFSRSFYVSLIKLRYYIS